MPQGPETDTNAPRRTVEDLTAKRKLAPFIETLDRTFAHRGSLYWAEFTSKILTKEGKPVSAQTVTIAFCRTTCSVAKDRFSNTSGRDVVDDYLKGFERMLNIVEKLLEDPYLKETFRASDEITEDLYMAIGIDAITQHNKRGTTLAGFVEEGENRYAVLEGAKKARVVYGTYLPVAKTSLRQVQPKSGT